MTLEHIIALLEESQWWTREQLQSRQQASLARLVAHHSQHNESFKQRLAAQGLAAEDVSTLAGLAKLKPIAKRYIQQSGTEFNSLAVPPSHLPIRKSQTSGRTGQPVTIMKTEMNHQFFCALMFREHA